MTVLLDLDGAVTHADPLGWAVLAGSVVHAPPASIDAEQDGSITFLDLANALQPGPGALQTVAVRVTVRDLPGVGEVVLGPLDLLAWSVEHDQDQGTAWTLDLPASRDGRIGPLGTERRWQGPPPGPAPITFEAVYTLEDQTEIALPLVTDGLSVESERTIERGDGEAPVHRLALTGLGPEGRTDRCRVRLALPPRHGHAHGEIIRRLALAADVPEASIEIDPAAGAPRTLALDVVDEEWRVPARDAARAARLALGFDARGMLVLRPRRPEGAPVWRLTLADVIAGAGGVTVTTSGEVPTCLTVIGRTTERPGEGTSGAVTEVEIVEVYDTFAIPAAHWQQDPTDLVDGLLLPLPGPGPAEHRLERRTTKRSTSILGGCPWMDEIIEEAWHAPEAARYRLDTAGEPFDFPICWLYEADATAGDSTTAYAWPRHRFGVVSYQRTTHQRDSLGRKTGEEAVQGRRQWIEEAAQERALASEAWEDAPYRANILARADRVPVATDVQPWMGGPGDPLPTEQALVVDLGFDLASPSVPYWAEVQREAITIDADGYVRARARPRVEWSIRAAAGGRFRFADGTVSDAPRMGGQPPEETRHAYLAEGEDRHVETEQTRRSDGTFGPLTATTRSGYLPAADVWSAELADRASTRTVEATVCVEVDDGTPCNDGVEIVNDFVESEAEAEALARMELSEVRALTVSLPVVLNAGVEECQRVELWLPELDVVGRGVVRRVTHGQDAPKAPALTRVTVSLDPEGLQ